MILTCMNNLKSSSLDKFSSAIFDLEDWNDHFTKDRVRYDYERYFIESCTLSLLRRRPACWSDTDNSIVSLEIDQRQRKFYQSPVTVTVTLCSHTAGHTTLER